MSYLAIVFAQLLYTLSDAWKKTIFNAKGFNFQAWLHPTFVLALLVTGVGFYCQMFALSRLELSRTTVILGMLAIIFSAAAGVLLLKEHLNIWNYFGLGLALLAIIFVNWR